MFFGKNKKRREGALDDASIMESIKSLVVNDGVTVDRINWDGSTSTVSGRVSHVSNNFDLFGVVDEGSGESMEFSVEDGDIAHIKRIAIRIDIDETQTESYMSIDAIVEILEALDHSDTISVSYYDPYKGKGVSKKGIITLKDEYNKVFAIEYTTPEGEKEEKHFDLNEDKIIDIIIN
ncbi:hypothetical protein JNM05_03530 [bacterium]|nr:hypothetical protein [bacterium]